MSLPVNGLASATRRDDTAHPQPEPEPAVVIPTMIALRYHTRLAAGHAPEAAMYLTMQAHYAPALRRALAAEARKHAANQHLQEMLDGRMRRVEQLQARQRRWLAGRSWGVRFARWLGRSWRARDLPWLTVRLTIALALLLILLSLPHLVGR